MKKLLILFVTVLAFTLNTEAQSLPTVLNTVDAQRDIMVEQVDIFTTARETYRVARQTVDDAFTTGGAVDQAIRLADSLGLGQIITAGFLDTVSAGNIIDFSFSSGAKTLLFTYEKDIDEIRDIIYFNKARTKLGD